MKVVNLSGNKITISIFLLLLPTYACANTLDNIEAYICGEAKTAPIDDQHVLHSGGDNTLQHTTKADTVVSSIAKLDVVEHEYPDGKKIVGNCGASVISGSWLVTAAHCVAHTPWHRIEITTGVTNLLDPDRITRTVTKALCHKSYNPISLENDIALLQIDSPFPKGFPFAKLADFQIDTMVGTSTASSYITAGWNRTKNQSIANQLRESPMRIVGREDNNFIVATSVDVNSPALCTGESGGPLLAKQANQGFVQVGILSAVEGRKNKYTGEISEICNNIDKSMSYFTPVNKYNNWILAVQSACTYDDCI